MADETKDPVDASKREPSTPAAANIAPTRSSIGEATITAPDSLQGAPEATILEETIIPREKKASSPLVPPPPAPPKIAPPLAPVAAPRPVSVPPVTPPVPLVAPVSSAPATLPEQKTIGADPSRSPRSRSDETGRSGVEADITKILEEVKLPERRNQKSAADAKGILSAPQQAPSPQGGVAGPAQTRSAASGRDAKREEGNVSAVHTLKDDLQSVVRDKKISVVRAVSLEEERRVRKVSEKVAAPVAQKSNRVFGIIFSTTLLLFLGAGALFGVYTIMQQGVGAPPSPENSSSILFAEQSVLLSIDNTSQGDLKRLLASARTSQNGSLGSIARIVPVKTIDVDGSPQQIPATFSEFMQALGVHAPESLIRAVSPDFFFGIHTVDKNAPLFVIPVISYDNAFAGMLAWEEFLNADLAPAFTSVPALATDENGLPVKRTFKDLVMRNYDVRALKDNAGTIQLYYSFPTQNILVIAESPYSFTEILSRLQAGRKL